MSELTIPSEWCENLDQQWTLYCEKLQQQGRNHSFFAEPELKQQLMRVWGCSEFVLNVAQRDPLMMEGLFESGDLSRSYGDGELFGWLNEQRSSLHDEASLNHLLRRRRQREMVRIAWRDIVGIAGLSETTADLSDLADSSLQVALDAHYGWLSERHGIPRCAQGKPQQLVVLGMGKLGARELNYSSDIDLIYAFPEQGETDGEQRSISNEAFFRQLGQKLIHALDHLTEDGQVFRVDMRLRPFGESGPLVISFAAMEQYYQFHGREWERYAMIKARVCAGDRKAGEQLMALLKPFVYRRYIDYGVFDSLREMKRMIMQEVKRKGMQDNVKLGPGGIREVEFIGQVFQLIRGGRCETLQRREILYILQQLVEQNCLPDFVVKDLKEAYLFLRNSEHRIQQWRDQQTHNLPTDDAGKLRLAVGMGFPEWESYRAVLQSHRDKVQGHFEQIISAPQKDQDDHNGLSALWLAEEPDDEAEALLEKAGFDHPADVLAQLKGLRSSRALRALSPIARDRMDQLMPLLLAAVAPLDNCSVTLGRVMSLMETIAQRSAYVALLIENPVALSQLVYLFSGSPWIGRFLQQHPLLLDELLDPRTLYYPPDRAGLKAELAESLAGVAEGDLEQLMEQLRHFKQINVLRVAAADLNDALPLMKVSDHLTWIAEVLLEQIATFAWHDLAARHGSPVCHIDGGECDLAFAIVAYGKLGGLELGYSSDLDLVFLHAGATGETAGEKPIDNSVFFARLGQRIIHIMTTHTPSGVLYEADMRLRPSGASGLLVSSVNAFAEYQKERAWTWEHQALVRARVVVGDEKVRAKFNTIRAETLCQPREIGELQREVREMREKMRESLASKKEGKFDLKQGCGGIADIEFMVQYGVLAWSNEYPELCRFTDNIRILKMFAELALLSSADVALLCDAYRCYRAEGHRLSLQERPALADESDYLEYRKEVSRIWQQLMVAERAL